MPASSIAVVVILLIVVFGAVTLVRRSRSMPSQNRFGQEYQRAVRESGGSRGDVERELANRQERMQRMYIEELPAGAKLRYTEEWRTVQTSFVDEPKAAIAKADRLIANVMRERGYQVDNFQSYLTAHNITERSETGEVTTEDLRQAMIRFRSLFDDLLK